MFGNSFVWAWIFIGSLSLFFTILLSPLIALMFESAWSWIDDSPQKAVYKDWLLGKAGFKKDRWGEYTRQYKEGHLFAHKQDGCGWVAFGYAFRIALIPPAIYLCFLLYDIVMFGVALYAIAWVFRFSRRLSKTYHKHLEVFHKVTNTEGK